MKMRIFVCLMIAASLIACAKKVKTVNLNELFTLKGGEVVNINSTPINIKMLENGIKKDLSGNDVTFCKFEVKYKGVAEERILEMGAFAAFDEFNIRIEKINLAPDPTRASCVFSAAKTLG